MQYTSRQIEILTLKMVSLHALNFMDCWRPISCPTIASVLHVSVGRVRSAMKKLQARGLVVRDSCIWDREESLLPYNGFVLAEAGYQTGIYRYMAKKEAAHCAACFGGTEEEYFRAFTELK